MAEAALTPQLLTVGLRRPPVEPVPVGPLHAGDQVTVDVAGAGWALVCLTEVRGELLSGIVTQVAGETKLTAGDRVRLLQREIYSVESIGESS